MMGFEFGGLFGLIILVVDVWAIVNIFESRSSTGKKVVWIVGVVVFPVIGFLFWLFTGPRENR